MFKVLFCLILITCGSVLSTDPEIEEEEARASVYLAYLNKKYEDISNKVGIANWAYDSNITDATLKHKLNVSEEAAKERKKDWMQTIKFKWETFTHYDLKRQLKLYSILGESALPDEKYKKLSKIISDMKKIYSTTKICSFKDEKRCDLSLEPELTELLINSTNADELKYIWIEWRKAVGPKIKRLYKEYVDYENEAARLNKFADNGEYWLHNYESKDFRDQIKSLWEEIKPLYLQIHAYVRFQLRQKYGDIVSEKGPIPAHLLGNMWAQTWGSIAAFTAPFPNKTAVDISKELVAQGYTSEKIFKTAEDFFVSLNLSAMPPLFWERSILEKPSDGRQMICHASAWDFSDGKDFRIKQCTRISAESFRTAHHEMGHVEYFLQYKHQPQLYRGGANDGFHEAVGDVIALSVSTTKHLKKIGLLKDSADDSDSDLNNLYKIGLDKIVFLPFAYVMDLWRWDVFSGNTTSEDYNCKWWQLRNEFQGIEPPVDRTESDFDPAAKYHVVANVPYLRYFISFIIQFQFHRSLCEKAGQYVPNDPSRPLHECDIYQSAEAGNALGKMLQMGASRPWPDAMEVLTGQRNMDASGLLEYFDPLRKWLEAENTKNNVHIGWESPQKVCKKESKDES